jgi:hypothetical protein
MGCKFIIIIHHNMHYEHPMEAQNARSIRMPKAAEAKAVPG